MPEEFDLKIKEIIPRADKVKSFRLEKAAGRHFKAGQFLCARLKIEAECKRYLSISSSPTEAGYIEFTKKITGSVFSKTLDGLRPGDSLIIQYPFGKFTLQDADKKIAFLSGGIGVTPIRSICKDAVDRKTGVDIVVIYANRSLMDIIFREDFDGMQQAGAKLRVVHVLCEPAPDFRCVPGLINARVLA